MTIHFQRELTLLRKQILTLGAAVENAISSAVVALLANDEEKAQNVINGDKRIDQLEIQVEEECLMILALYQPVAHDLRFIVSVLKMNNDLERMGDHALNVAKRARFLARQSRQEVWPAELKEMAENVKTMVKESLDALIATDANLARHVCESDKLVDTNKRQIGATLRDRLMESQSPQTMAILLKMIDVPRHLERIADLATNIAEDVIYLAEGTIVRHHFEE